MSTARRKRVLLVGGSGALGRAVAAALLEGGARVALTYHRSEAPARAIAAKHPEGIAGVLPMDLASVASIEACVEGALAALDGLDSLVIAAAAGVSIEGGGVADPSHYTISNFDQAAWDRMLDVNLRGPFFALRAVAGPLARAGGGDIVITGSIDGVKFVPSPVPYAASKAALAGLVRSAAKELGPQRIRVNQVAPGVMDEGLSRHVPAHLREEYVKHCGAKRAGRTSEVAAALAWLALENTYVTGQTIVVDGAL